MTRIKTIPIFILYIFTALVLPAISTAQPIIYTDQSTTITGTWNGNCTIAEVSTAAPFEGNAHYKIDYSAEGFWAGVGLNMDNWGNSSALDFTNFNAIRIAYRGMNSDHSMRLALRDNNQIGNEIEIGGATSNYTEKIITFSELTLGTSIDLTAITEINISFGSSNPTYTGEAFFDAIELLNTEVATGSPATLATWARFEKMDRGVNFANWLEAYWLIPFDAYPEVEKYDRAQVQSLIDQGFNSVRLPVTFEQIADENPPYTIPTTSVVWNLIDSVITWAVEMDFTLIITNHHGYDLTNANYTSEINRIQSIWTQVMSRYATLDPERYFFELFNEPADISPSNLHAVYDSAIATIRSFGATHSLIVGGNFYNSLSGLTASMTYADSNIIYTIHSYDPYFFTHQGMSWTSPPNFPALPFPNAQTDSQDVSNIILGAKQWSDLNGVPVMLGEFGVSSSADATSRCNYVEAMSNALYAYDMPWYYWDAISPVNAFGFINGNNVTQCFETALRLGDENTCTLMVTSKNEANGGSIQSQLACATPGDTILFSLAIAGDTISVSSLPIIISKNVFFQNSNAMPVYISTTDQTSLFYIATNVVGGLENIHLLSNGNKVIENFGSMHLNRVDIKLNDGSIFSPLQGVYILDGDVQILKE